jgi:hypothetical protein
MSMSLPPEGTFPTFAALENSAQRHAAQNGYAISTIRWVPTTGTFRKYFIGCTCAGKYRDRMKHERRRQKVTAKTEC